MTYRKSEHPLIVFAYVAVAVTIGIAIGLQLGVDLRTCPAKLDDGRPLLGIVLKTNECKYAGIPRPLEEVSSIELRRMAVMRDRLGKVN